MVYANIQEAIFLSRPNRFIAQIQVDGKIELAHVKNTGRCKELLLPGSKIFVQKWDLPHRKTKFDLISVYKGQRLINLDSVAPNKVFQEWAKDGKFLPNISLLKAEVLCQHSRFDFYIETDVKKIFVEIKGVTLEQNGVAMFPDAPTLRGLRHVDELAELAQNGFECYVIFIIQMLGVSCFTPSDSIHKAFGDALRRAQKAGVHILALDCTVSKNDLWIHSPVFVKL